MPSQKKDNLHHVFESMSVSAASEYCRDSSKGNISWLRVHRKETTFSGAGLGMDRIDSRETKGSPSQPQVQSSVSVSQKIFNLLFWHLLKHFNPHERDGDRG